MSIHGRVAAARERLRTAGISPAESDLGARLLAQHLLGWDTARLLSSGHDAEPDGFGTAYEALIERRASREPLPYITGEREFWNLSFEVSPAVLIPRPETELIVEEALALHPQAQESFTVADACTGCGCVAIALARERPAARIVATDISAVAIDVARRNGLRHGVGHVQFVVGDLLDPIKSPVDLILCNPPYVAQANRRGLQPEVGDHEPAVAIFGGDDGLHLITRLVHEAPPRLRAGGYLVFEFGFGQDVEIESLLALAPDLTPVGLRRDLQGIARTAVARKN
jgi:release factor glutamine methyltransferase